MQLKTKMPLRVLLSVILWCGFVSSLCALDITEWQYAGESYESLEEAEAAMKAQPGYADSRRDGEIQLNGDGSIVTIHYSIPRQPATVERSYWRMYGNADGSCNGPWGYCGSPADAVDAYINGLVDLGFCNIQHDSSSEPYVYRVRIEDELVGNAWHFVVEERQDNWWFDHDHIDSGSGDCMPSHPPHLPTLRQRSYAHCPDFYTPSNTGQYWSETYCFNSRTAVIVGRVLQVCSDTEGNPCSPVSGDKIIHATDYAGPRFEFKRTWHSGGSFMTPGMPVGWSHNFGDRLVGSLNGYVPVVHYIDSDGRYGHFKQKAAGEYVAVGSKSALLMVAGGNASIYFKNGDVKHFDSSGRLIEVRLVSGEVLAVSYEGSSRKPAMVSTLDGRSLAIAYDGQGYLQSIVTPDSYVINYEVDAMGRLLNVTRAAARIEYTYSSNSNYLIDGITDELGQAFATYEYDAYGRVISSEHAGGAGRVQLAYGVNETVVTRPLGEQVTYRYDSNHPRLHVGTIISHNDVEHREYSYSDYIEAVLRSASTDTEYTRDAYGRIISTVETDDNNLLRRRSSLWDEAIGREVSIETRDENDVVVARVEYDYNVRGQTEEIREYALDGALTSRVSTLLYCEAGDVGVPGTSCAFEGFLKEFDGPLPGTQDRITYTYRLTDDESGCDSTSPAAPCHRRGDLWKVTNGVGHVTEYLRYDRAGRVRAMQDANGVVTTYDYHPRGWLTDRSVRGPVDKSTTSYTYDAVGQVTRVTQPDGSWTGFEYDAAHRMTAVTDNFGNRVEYTLDAAGNRTAEHTKDPGGTIRRTLGRVYDQLGRLQQELDAQSRITEFDYDANGNRTLVEDALDVQTQNDYDPLDRLSQTIQDLGGIEATTGYEYDALDRLVKVTDPKGLETEYVYDGLGNLLELRSPDTGVTTYTYDAAGNRLTQTDARGITTTYAYDGLSRLTSVSYPTSSLDVSYHYDESDGVTGCSGSYPIGRLTRMVDETGTTTYCYDERGNVTRKTHVGDGITAAVQYRYDLADRLTRVTYPSGAYADYTRDAGGRITAVDTYHFIDHGIWMENFSTAVIENAQYLPFGPVSSYALGDGSTLTRSYDANYWTEGVESAALDLPLGTDAVGNIVSLGDPLQRSYEYDDLYRLTEVEDAVGAILESFGYDATGNRTQKGSTSYGYPATSHRLTQVGSATRSYDAAGNTTAAALQYEYGDHSRLTRVYTGSTTLATYAYNGRGERLVKTDQRSLPAGQEPDTRRFVYDESGKLLGEYSAAGLPIQEFVWMDDLPVAVLPYNGAFAGPALFVHADHLGTPRAVTRLDGSATQTVWSWPLTGTAFGEHPPTAATDGTGKTFVLNLRYPGQRYDVESGLHYNYFRDYEPGTGRYIESDPIGLDGGINTYVYVVSRPLDSYDPTGESVAVLPAPVAAAGVCLPCAGAFAGGFAAGSIIYREYGTAIVDTLVRITKGRWTCTASCNVQQIDPSACCPDRTYGAGGGSNQNEACRNAKRAATQSTPRGCYSRHCQCDCYKN